MRQILIGVEYTQLFDEDTSSNFEVFETIEEAREFKKDLEDQERAFSHAFMADFSLGEVYRSGTGLNYEDNSELYVNRMMINLYP